MTQAKAGMTRVRSGTKSPRGFNRNFNPTALVTATRVDSRGFPRVDKARCRPSRSTPAALATLAMPPLASALRRRAIRSTAGSSASSNAAFRYSATNLGFPRNLRITYSSCETLVISFFLVSCIRGPCAPSHALNWQQAHHSVIGSEGQSVRKLKAKS
jgi:hypothetical protein